MKRFAEAHLETWLNKKTRMPLIIRGARQVGKSSLVKIFAQEKNLDLIEFNLEKTKLKTVQTENFKIQSLLDEIQIKSKKKIQEHSLLFFDEIQESPQLLKFLRYFFEERPQIAVICAGSLLEIALQQENFSFPVGRVEFFHLGPMNFYEFLYALGDIFLLEKLKSQEITEEIAQEAKKKLLLYYYIGGMPKAVKTYIEEESLFYVREIQEQIIQTYLSDFPKYNSKIKIERVEKIFYQSANLLGKKIIYSKLDKESKSREVKKALELLIEARVLLRCNHSEANTLPLRGEIDSSIFKIYFLDIGLLSAIMRLEFEIISENKMDSFNLKGILAEQFVAQHLAYLKNERQGPEIFYWLKDKGAQKGEIDFIISKNQNIIPIEVKSTSTGHLKSLFYFCAEKNKKKAIKISMKDYSLTSSSHKINGENISVEILNLPLYLIESLYDLEN